MDSLQNILAFGSTFIVISTFTMSLLHVFIYSFTHKKKLDERQERYVVYTGIVVAVLLAPFYLPY